MVCRPQCRIFIEDKLCCQNEGAASAQILGRLFAEICWLPGLSLISCVRHHKNAHLSISGCSPAGLLSFEESAVTRIICTEAVQLPLSCLSVGGPVNITSVPIFQAGTVGQFFQYRLDWLLQSVPYIGTVTVAHHPPSSNVHPSATARRCLLSPQIASTTDLNS